MQFNTSTLFTLFSCIALAQCTKIVTIWETVTLPIDMKPAVTSEVASTTGVTHENVVADINLLPTTFVTKTTGTIASAAESSVTSAAMTETSAEVISTASVAVSTSSASGDVHSGIATFYSVSADNCGTSSTDADFVCAISHSLYETSVNGEDVSSYCGKSINITYNGKTITVKVVDSCESCDDNHLDLSPAAFEALASPDLGVIDISWAWA